MNFDDCIVVGRDAVTHKLIPDPLAFPRGPAAVSADLAALGFKMGWYTVRNDKTCASGPPPRLMRPGSYGYEALDAETWVAWNVSYIKDDSCGNPQGPYPVQRDALNATGKPIFFSMCEPGQGPVTAPVGRSWGNGWRIDEDDGGLWRPVLDNINMVAPLWPYSGCGEQHNNDGFVRLNSPRAAAARAHGCAARDAEGRRRRRRRRRRARRRRAPPTDAPTLAHPATRRAVAGTTWVCS